MDDLYDNEENDSFNLENKINSLIDIKELENEIKKKEIEV